MTKRLFIISNRLPVSVAKEDDKVIMKVSSGGLISAMKGYVEFSTSKNTDEFDKRLWVGVPGCSPASWAGVESKISGEFEYLPVFINNHVYDNYYNGLSNSVIWPLFHYFPSYAEYNTKYYENYLSANHEFFEVICRSLREDDTIWIHDYHLLPLAAMIREKFPAITIGFFLHIPFPSYELFRLMPPKWQEGLLTGMLGADLVGFHTIDYATHFLKSIQMVLGLEDERNIIKYKNRLVKVDVFPISIDYEKYNSAYNIKEVAILRDFYHTQFQNKRIIFSVDRLDYTKYVLGRLKGYETFFKLYPQYLEKVVFILNLIPSRDSIPNYINRKREIDEFIGNFNSRVGNIKWKPVIYQYAHLEFAELMALYTSCDIALITPLRDGMNLVAKEFVASRQDKNGVLLLSEMTGAARELTDALMINPNDATGIAEKIKEALDMDKSTQENKMTLMQKRIKNYDVNIWAEDFLTQLRSIKNKQKQFEFIFLDNDARRLLIEKYRNAGKRLLLLDYDGTLVPFSSLPQQSAPDHSVINVLSKIASDKHNHIFIISGRDSNTLQKWLGQLPINLIAEHGSKMRLHNKEWTAEVSSNDDEWKTVIQSVMDTYVKRCVNTFVEQKEYSLVWHFRNADVDQAKIRSAELFSELCTISNQFNLQVVQGNKIIEVRMRGMDKGTITKKLLSENDYDFILACGDDSTDEDMFKLLATNEMAYTIKIGDVASFAKFNLYTPQMTVSLLDTLSGSAPELYL